MRDGRGMVMVMNMNIEEAMLGVVALTEGCFEKLIICRIYSVNGDDGNRAQLCAHGPWTTGRRQH